MKSAKYYFPAVGHSVPSYFVSSPTDEQRHDIELYGDVRIYDDKNRWSWPNSKAFTMFKRAETVERTKLDAAFRLANWFRWRRW